MEKERIDLNKFLDYVKGCKAEGKTAKQIAKSLGLSVTRFKELLRKAKALVKRKPE